ncbi:Hsp70 family protein [Methylobacterium pseudosasicola]|uniref:Molecular chaperone DnaK n=1 Tax=Methylobacterium pseudosasicola TaxID=582667 RepID=A0A1I4R3Y6_9HYPH|nr:molecular chaperone DnaK [Methylobacterium pseudosasicola]
MAADNKMLGQFDLVGIPRAPRGTPQIEVTFDIDANGIVNVAAKDKASGKEQQIRIQASGGLEQSEIQRMVREAEAHAEEDKRRRELADASNQADAAIYTAERSQEEAGERVPSGLRTELQQAIAAVREAIGSEVADRIKQATERLSQLAQQLAQFVSAPPEGAAASGGGNAPQSEVVDAEFEEHGRRDQGAH